MNKIDNKSYSPDLIFLKENIFHEDKVDFRPQSWH